MNRRTKVLHTDNWLSPWLSNSQLERYLKLEDNKQIKGLYITETMTREQAKEYLKEFNITLD